MLDKIELFREAGEEVMFKVVLALLFLPVPLSANTTVVTLTKARIIVAFLMNLSMNKYLRKTKQIFVK